jgi:hypothetical protein
VFDVRWQVFPSVGNYSKQSGGESIEGAVKRCTEDGAAAVDSCVVVVRRLDRRSVATATALSAGCYGDDVCWWCGGDDGCAAAGPVAMATMSVESVESVFVSWHCDDDDGFARWTTF